MIPFYVDCLIHIILFFKQIFGNKNSDDGVFGMSDIKQSKNSEKKVWKTFFMHNLNVMKNF